MIKSQVKDLGFKDFNQGFLYKTATQDYNMNLDVE